MSGIPYITLMSIQEMEAYIVNHPWKTARATDNPHQYTLRKQANDAHEFERFVQTTREQGYKVMFWGQKYSLFNIGDFRYWAMREPINEVTVLNRANNVTDPLPRYGKGVKIL